ncbi:hypothetical protein BDR04DRAFT_1116284 [Suillus decipiens]|nr:hypothetical protein BDR04DRAFT_1116284 [Suillus decipiens]
MTITRAVTHVEQVSASKSPFLTTGQISPEGLCAWEMGCAQLFLHKEVKDDEKVKKVAWDFMDKVHTHWLPTDWVEIIQCKLLATVQGQCTFTKWAIEIQSQNTLLCGTTSHLTDVHILYHLESHMNVDLAADCCTEKKEAVNSAICTEHACITVTYKRPEGCEKLEWHTVTKPNNPTSSRPTKDFVRLPQLTEKERQLLHDNEGCYKCQEPFTGHTSSNCTKGFSDGATYKPVTAASIAAKKMKKKVGVVTVLNVDETNDDESNTVAVIMPSAVLGNGTDSGKECMAPLQTSHLRWTCLLNRPAVTSPISVSTLIDYGLSLVLIGEELVKRLSL